ncbi:MAG TPA: DUF1592 domain-containing protein, partial [Polyangia bacterium]|nr:DUF1592 domain-containing protein [Polyangia bacterium]
MSGSSVSLRVAVGWVVLSLSAVACTGAIGGPSSPGGSPGGGAGAGQNGSGAGGPGMVVGPAVLGGRSADDVLASCGAPSPGRAPLRRLSNAEYRNTISDLFASVPSVLSLVSTATQTFPPEPQSLGFRNSADYLSVPSLAAQAFLDAADQFSQAAAQAPGFVTCASGVKDATCASAFIASFGQKAYRRPLTADDTARYTALYQKAIAGGYDFQTGIEWIVFAMLQSPQFLYRFELGGTAAGSAVKPSPYEIASRLSYLYWQSMPDAALFDAAASGQLGTTAQIETQARRLLADPRAARLLEYFDQWLDLDAVQEMTRDATVFANLDPQLPSLLLQETNAFVADVLHAPGGSFEQLLTAPYTFANAALAKHYGLGGPAGAGFEKVAAPGRSGVLTQGMMLAHDKPTRTSIVRRGLKIRTDVLCQTVPAPPPNVDTDLGKLGANLTQRQRLEQHRQNSACASCHNLMDPIGVVFEGFDAVGRPRTVDETGQPVVLASELDGTADANGPVADPVALGQRLAGSD